MNKNTWKELELNPNKKTSYMILTGNFFPYQTSNKGSNIPRLSYPCKIVSWHPINKPVAISTKCYYRIQSNKLRNL